jgi:hypothetical protein
VITELREALRTEADEAPVYAVYERAMKTARRRRRHRWSAFTAAIGVLVLLVLTAIPGGFAADGPSPAGDGAQPAIPDRLAFPPALWPSVTGRPAGPASVLFGGQGFPVDSPNRLFDNEGDFAVVGATADVYRMLRVGGYEAHAGEDVLLSPDGGRLAIPSGMNGPAVLDLTTGRQPRLTAFTDSDYVTPLAWSPDGRTLAVEAVVADGGAWIGLVDVPDGTFRRMSRVDRATYLHGFAAAFSPDGQRWAYQNQGQIVIADRNLQVVHRIEVSGRDWLAGKAAWTPDGRLMLVTEENAQWMLRSVSPKPLGPEVSVPIGLPADPARPVGGMELAAVRLIGWTGGQPVVVVFKKEPTAPIESQPETAYQAVHSVEVWRLTATGHEVLLTTPHNLMSIDLPDAVIAAGRVRPADPPRFGIVTVLGGLVALVLAVVVGRAVTVRLRAYGSGRRPGASSRVRARPSRRRPAG